MTDISTTATTLPTAGREVRLVQRPSGEPTPADFELAEAQLPELADGDVLVKNLMFSVDPYMRGRMNDVKSYVPPFELGKAMDGGAVGTVISSRSDALKVGDAVVHGLGWREYAVLPAARTQKVSLDGVDASAYLGALGMTGLTAYAGLTQVASFTEGDVVFVSGAAGAVGSMVGQIAKLLGARRVIGSAGSAEKVQWLLAHGFDAAFNYKDAPVAEQLRNALGDEQGIDVYFDNVGGDHLEAAIGAMNKFGRIAMCGAIAQYNSTGAPTGPRNLALAIGKNLTLRGFIVGEYQNLAGEYREKMANWIKGGKISWTQTAVHGIENGPQAFIDLLNGANLGKMVVTLA
ncbi:MAG: NADP-dependent oxidoreductase [Acidobacteria bacterium]|nr:NADP-dependent oxidoreductase [Acidobacteriota bacterium]